MGFFLLVAFFLLIEVAKAQKAETGCLRSQTAFNRVSPFAEGNYHRNLRLGGAEK